MIEKSHQVRAVGLHMLGDKQDGLTERSKDVVRAALELHNVTPFDRFYVSGREFSNPSRTQAGQVTTMLSEAGIPEDSIASTTAFPSTTSYEMQYFANQVQNDEVNEFVGISSRTHEPSIKLLLSRHLCNKADRVVVFAFEDVLTTLPTNASVRDEYEEKFKARQTQQDEINWRSYEKKKAFRMRIPGVEKLFNLIAWRFRPQITAD